MNDVDLDPASPPGAAGVLARLAAKEEARRAERAQRQELIAARSDPREDVDRYLSWFNAQQSDLAATVRDAADAAAAIGSGAAAASTTPAAAAPDAPRNQQNQQQQQRAELSARLDALLARAADLEGSTAGAAYYLPAYDLKRASAALQELRAAAEGARAALLPRRKFAFSSRPRGGGAAAAAGAAAIGVQSVADASAAASNQQQQPTATATTTNTTSTTQQQPAAAPEHKISDYDLKLIADGHGLKGLSGATVVRTSRQLADREFVLHDLSDCEVWLLGEMPALRMARLRNCRVVAGPVRGATFVDEAEGCTFALASHQVRLHRMSDAALYLRVKSRPIIEHCRGVKFAPLTDRDLHAAGLAAAAEAAGLGSGAVVGGGAAAGGGGESQAAVAGAAASGGAQAQGQGAEQAADVMWRSVDDFGWVKATPSPHWRVMEGVERRALGAPPAGAGR